MSKNKRSKRTMFLGLGAVVVVGGIVGALALKGDGADDRVDMDATRLCQVTKGDLVVSILQTGELKAKSSRAILNEAYRDAKITYIVEDGSCVTNGQLLFELESTQLEERLLDQQSDVAEAKASLKLAQEGLEIAKLKNATDLDSAELNVELATLDLEKYMEVEYTQMVDKATSDIYLAEQQLQTARGELEGTKELFAKGYSNQNEVEADKYGVESREIEVRNKKKDLHILKEYTHKKQVKELENSVKSAKSALERLKKTILSDVQSKEASILSKETRLEIECNQLVTRETQYSNTKAYADFDGQVFYPKMRRGGSLETVGEGATVQYRQAILSYPDLSAWDIKVGIPEALIDKVTLGQETVATLDAVPGLIVRGTVSKISAVPDSQGWYNSGVKKYTIMVAVNSGVVSQLKPGMSSTLEVVTDELMDVLQIPIQSVISKDEKNFVYVVERGRKVLREVVIGKYNTHRIEIKSGLEEGEQLLLIAEVELDPEPTLKKKPRSEQEKNRKSKGKQ